MPAARGYGRAADEPARIFVAIAIQLSARSHAVSSARAGGRSGRGRVAHGVRPIAPGWWIARSSWAMTAKSEE
jgi:hypothetical protein